MDRYRFEEGMTMFFAAVMCGLAALLTGLLLWGAFNLIITPQPPKPAPEHVEVSWEHRNVVRVETTRCSVVINTRKMTSESYCKGD